MPTAETGLPGGPVCLDCGGDPGLRGRGVHAGQEYVLAVQTAFAPNEFSASTMLVPPSRSAPPESPKQLPPLFEWSLRNSSLITSLLATSVVAAKNRVVESPDDFLQFGSHGPPPLTKFCTP